MAGRFFNPARAADQDVPRADGTTSRDERSSSPALDVPQAKRQRTSWLASAHTTTSGRDAGSGMAKWCNHGDSLTSEPRAPTSSSPVQSPRSTFMVLRNVGSNSAQPSRPAAVPPSPCHIASRTSSFSSTSTSAAAWGPVPSQIHASRDSAAKAAVDEEPGPVTLPRAAPGALGWRYLHACTQPLAAPPCLEGPEEWMARVHSALGLSSPDTLRLALHTWRRVQPPVTMLVHLRTRAGMTPGTAVPAAALGCGPASSSGSSGYCSGCGSGGSPAPFSPAAAAGCPVPSWSSAVLATSKRIRTERAFAAACVRLASKLQEQREVTRTVTEPLAAASGTSVRIIMNAEVCVLRWLDWDLLGGFVREDAHLICGVGWEL